jgi:uncharacterized ion transporter superfamily protein YfcC
VTSSRFRVPHTLVLLFGMVVFAQLLTYVLPKGEFERRTNEVGREEVVAGSYGTLTDVEPLSPLASLSAIPKGLEAAQDIIFFVLLIGGAFAVMRATGAIDALIGFLLARLGGKPGLLIGGGIALFAAGSAAIGMAEEYLPFVPVLIVLTLGLGFDRITAVGILCVGYSVGYGAALINPFTVLIAQDVAGLEPASGLWYRAILLLVFAVIGFLYVYRYAVRVHADPSKSLMADLDIDDSDARVDEHPEFNGTRIAILVILIAALALLVYGIKFWHWYLVEMGALFLGLTLVMGIVARINPSRVAKVFCFGAAELSTTAILIGFARSIQVVLDEGKVVDTIINSIATPLESLPAAFSAIGMFFFQSLCNLFIPSGSGQAYVTMPLMAPLSDLVGVQRQVAVLAYQFGDGFTNIIVPTNAVLVSILAMAKVPIDRWWRFIMPFMLVVWIVGSVALAVAVLIGYS